MLYGDEKRFCSNYNTMERKNVSPFLCANVTVFVSITYEIHSTFSTGLDSYVI